MSDATDTNEPGEASAPSNEELAGRVDALDSKLDTILDKLGGAKDQAHADAQQHTEDRLDRPSNIADEIRQQLAERDRQQQATAAQQADTEWRKGVDERLAGMTEKTPEAPVRWIENKMGWRG